MSTMPEQAKPKNVKQTSHFNRETLRRTKLALFDNDIFQITTCILDRDSLSVIKVVSHFSKQSMHILAYMYIVEFLNVDSVVFDDPLS